MSERYRKPRTKKPSSIINKYFTKIVYPKYKFSPETYFISLINSVLTNRTHQNIQFKEMVINENTEEYLSHFVPRNEYVQSFYSCFINNPDYCNIFPNDKLIDNDQIIKTSIIEKKRIEKQILIELHQIEQLKKQKHQTISNEKKLGKKYKADSSFNLQNEINDEELNLSTYTENEEEIEKENNSPNRDNNINIPLKKEDSFESVECFVLYLNTIENLRNQQLDKMPTIKIEETFSNGVRNSIKTTSKYSKLSILSPLQSDINFVNNIKSTRSKRRPSKQETYLKYLQDLEFEKGKDIKRRSTLMDSANLTINTPHSKTMMNDLIKNTLTTKKRSSQFNFEFTIPNKKDFPATEKFIISRKEKEKTQNVQQETLFNEILFYSKQKIIKRNLKIKKKPIIFPFLNKTMRNQSKNKKLLSVQNYQVMGKNIANKLIYKLSTKDNTYFPNSSKSQKIETINTVSSSSCKKRDPFTERVTNNKYRTIKIKIKRSPKINFKNTNTISNENTTKNNITYTFRNQINVSNFINITKI